MRPALIRPATPSDAGGIAALINQEIRSGLAIWRNSERSCNDIRNMLTERLALNHGVFVATSQDTIVGWAGYGPFRSGEGYARTVEHSVHIAGPLQRQGIARRLMEDLTAHATQNGICSMIGAIEAGNTASISLHEKLGFLEAGRLPRAGHKFGKWLTLILMHKILAS